MQKVHPCGAVQVQTWMPVPVHCIFAFESQRASHNKPTFLRGLCHVDIDSWLKTSRKRDLHLKSPEVILIFEANLHQGFVIVFEF